MLRVVLAAVLALGTAKVRSHLEARLHQAKVMLGAMLQRELPITKQAAAVALVQLALTLLLQLWVLAATGWLLKSQAHQSHALAVVVAALGYIPPMALLEAQVVVAQVAMLPRQEPQIQVVEAEVRATAALQVAQVARVLSSSQSQLPITAARQLVRQRLRPAVPTLLCNLIHQEATQHEPLCKSHRRYCH